MVKMYKIEILKSKVVGAEITTLESFSDGLHPTILITMIEKTQFVKEEMDEVHVSPDSEISLEV